MRNVNRSAQLGGVWGWGLPAGVALLGGIALYSVVSLTHERSRSQQLAVDNQSLTASLHEVQGEIRAVSEKLSALATQPAKPETPQPQPQPEPVRRAAVAPKVRVAVARPPARNAADEARLRRIETNLAGQQKEIADTRQQADEKSQEMEGKLSSQHDELSGSIARNHDDLVALEKRGERTYYEFDLGKSKQFQRVGPISLSVRAVNRKHKYYDLIMTVDDQQLEKKHVNLYEPLQLTVGDRPQPIELVVNDIKNNEVQGYVSEPKYKKSELASTAPPPPPAPGDTKGLQRR
jgi:hypothetical protein